MNVVSNAAIVRLGLMIVKHPNPFQVAWASKTILPVTKRCLVPIQTGDYKDKIYCDVLPTDVARILLGRL